MAVPDLICEFAPGAGPLDLPAPAGGDAENFLRLDGGGWLETPDDDGLDLTTTFDIRLEIAPQSFAPAAAQALAGKWQLSELGFSWLLLLDTDGRLRLVWNDTDATGAIERTSTLALPTSRPRLAVRVAGDFSGTTDAISFSTATSVDGPWTQLGDAVDGSGNPLVDGNVPIRIGVFDPDLQAEEDEDPTGPGEPEPEPEPQVVFFDDFTTAFTTNRGLNPDVWFVHDRPDGDESYVNNEWQLYVPGQVSVENSLLVITCEHANPNNPGDTGPGSYLSGLVTTAGKLHFGPPSVTGGLRIEIRLRAPGSDGATQGLWPSLYTLEQGSADYFGGNEPGFPGGAQGVPGWPTTGKSEVDIWEWPGFTAFGYHTNRHWSEDPGGSNPVGGREVDTSPIDITATFNVYAFVWTESYMAWEFNGVEKHRIQPGVSPPPTQEMFAIINFAIGGDFGGTVGDNTEFPARYEIDWLKVTQLLPSAKVVTLTDDLDPPRSIWTAAGEAGQITATLGGVEVELGPNYPSYRTTSRGWDLTQSSIFVEVSEVPNLGAGTTQAFLTLTFNHVEGSAPAGEVRIGYDGGQLVGEHQTGGVYTEVFALAHDETTHRYWRLSEAGGTITYSTSPDGSTWTNRGTVATNAIGFSPTALDVELQAGHFGAETAPGTFRVEGVNVVGEGGTGEPPGGGEEPDETNTGLTNPGALSPAGFDRITTDGQVLEDLEFDVGYVEVQANNVTFRNCRFIGPSSREALVRVQAGKTGCLFEDCEVDGQGVGTGVGLAYGDYTARRCYIHNVQDGVKLGDNTTIEDCYITDLAHEPGVHNDGGQSSGGFNIVVRGTSIVNVNSQTSALLIGADLGDIGNVLVEGNWLDSHSHYTLTIGAEEPHSLTNCVIRNNRISRNHQSGVLNVNPDEEIDFVNNVYFDGAAIPDEHYP